MELAPTLSASDTLCAYLRMILLGLLAMLGAWHVEPVRAVALYRRISRTMSQIERMLVRFRAGRLWRMPQRDAPPCRQVKRSSGVVLPRRFGWLVQLGGHQAAYCGLQLQTVMTTPEMAELLADSAQARRILRPICRALAVELPGLGSAAAPQRDQPTPRRTRSRAMPEPFRIALPRGTLAAARRAGFGKDR